MIALLSGPLKGLEKGRRLGISKQASKQAKAKHLQSLNHSNKHKSFPPLS
jgi:hypothetical protein